MAKQVATIPFFDKDSQDDGFVAVTVHDDGAVGLSLSLKRNGDIDVFVEAKELDAIIEALVEARKLIGSAN